MRKLCLLVILSLVPFTAQATPPAAAAPLHLALIFDDGPVPAHAEQLLALFAREQVHVNFGYVAGTAEKNPATVRKVAAAGHEIVNHSFTHAHPQLLDEAVLEHEVLAAQASLTVVAGVAPRWYWPPFLEQDARLPALLQKAHLMACSLDNIIATVDWRAETTADLIRTNATTNLSDGAIILFHEWRAETVAQMPAIIAELKRHGCVLLTFSELAEYRRAQKSAIP